MTDDPLEAKMVNLGVVGAGTMGAGVADLAARSGHTVVLVDVDADALTRAVASIRKECRMSRLLTGVAVDADQVLGRITVADDLAALKASDLVVENVPERWPLKLQVYEALDRLCAPDTVFVANTSAFPITRIGAATSRPDRVIGVHFMNPAPLKSAAELIPGRRTSAETVAQVRAFLDSLGTRGIDVRDACGFVSNRVLMLTVNEAAFVVHDGVADAETVDDVFRSCFGHPMGPLETADLIGLDTVLYSLEVLLEHFGDPKFRPCPLLRALTDAGYHGRKTGQGFHRYDSQGHVHRAGGAPGGETA